MPSEKDIVKAVESAQKANHAPYEDPSLPSSLMAQTPKAGSIVSETPAAHGYTLLTLSNGMKVYVRPTTFEADEVNVRLFSLGGRSLYPNEDVPSLSYLASVIGASGVGQFDELSLEKCWRATP